ncbi:Uncharacterised protein [uncultured archaeon]|nr:Uncharacterised protein [uncultured archaeon]
MAGEKKEHLEMKYPKLWEILKKKGYIKDKCGPASNRPVESMLMASDKMQEKYPRLWQLLKQKGYVL